MKKLWEECWALIRKPWFIVPLCLTAVIGYGYVIGRPAVGVDDLSRGWYLEEFRYLRTGRLWGDLLLRLLGPDRDGIFVQELAATLLLLLSATLLSLWLMRACRRKLRPVCCTVFSCLFVSYPLIARIWVFDSAILAVSASYCLTALELILLDSFLRGERRIRKLIMAAMLVWIGYSLYQSHVLVYITGTFVYLALGAVFGSGGERRVKGALWEGLLFAGVLAAGLIVDALALRTALAILGAEKMPYYAYIIRYTDAGTPLRQTLVRLGTDLMRQFGLYGLYYMPIGVLQGAVCAAWALAAGAAVRNKRPAVLLPVAGACLSLILLPLIQGWFMDYRNYQQLALFVAVSLTLLLQWALCCWRRDWLKKLAVAALGLLCLAQAVSLSSWFRLDDRMDQQQRRILIQVHEQLAANFDLSKKPVVFLSSPEPSDGLKSAYMVHLEDERLRFLFPDAAQWPADVQPSGFYAGGADPQTLLEYMGYDDVIASSPALNGKAGALSPGLPWYPEAGYITETEAFILVKLGPLFEEYA